MTTYQIDVFVNNTNVYSSGYTYNPIIQIPVSGATDVQTFTTTGITIKNGDAIKVRWTDNLTQVAPTPTPTVTPTNTPTNTKTPTLTPTPSVTSTVTPSVTPTLTPTNTATPTATVTPTVTPSGGFDPNAQAFITAAGITGTTNQNAVNTLVKGLKSNNLWNKMIAVYPLMGGTATTTKYNLINPVDSDAAFRITWSGGVTYSVSGVTGNGSNGVGNTHWSPYNYNLSGQTIYNNLSTGVYRIDQNLTPTGQPNNRNYTYGVTTNNSSGGAIGYYTFTGTTNHFFQNFNSGLSTLVQVTGQTGTTGMFVHSRTSINNLTAYKNGSQFGSTNTTTLNYPTNWFPSNTANVSNISLFETCNDGLGNYYSNPTLNWLHISLGLNSTDVANLYTLVQAFNTTLNRKV